MLMFFQRHNRLYNKENDISMVLLKMHAISMEIAQMKRRMIKMNIFTWKCCS